MGHPHIYSITNTCPKLTQHELFAGANGLVGCSSLNRALEAAHMFVLWLSSLALTIPLLFLFVWALHVGSGTRMPNSPMNQLCHWGHLDSAAVGRHPKMTAMLICFPNKRLQKGVESYQLKQSIYSLNHPIIGAVTVSFSYKVKCFSVSVTSLDEKRYVWNNYWENNHTKSRIWLCSWNLPHNLHMYKSILCRLFDISCSYETQYSGVSHSSQRCFFILSLRLVLHLWQTTLSTPSLSFAFFLSFVSATHLMLIWQPPQCTIESSWPEITLGKGSRSALQLCWRQWHNSNTNQGAGCKTCTTTLQPDWK